MSDDLIKRLERWGESESLQNHFIGSRSARKDCAEAAATIARQQVMLDRALESNGDMQAEVARLREALNRIVGRDSHIDASIRSSGPDRVVEYGDFARIARAALEAKHG